MQEINFFKMQAVGNDYVFIEESENYLSDYSNLSKKISDRNFGVGGDGLIVLSECDDADVAMRIFNKDGSEGEICGNALRCVGSYLYKKELKNNHNYNVECCKGKSSVYRVLTGCLNNKKIRNVIVSNNAEQVIADMGKINFKDINLPKGSLEVNYQGVTYKFYFASIGNPHAVTLVKDLDLPAEDIVKELLNTNLFKNGINVEFAKITQDGAQMRVIERGSGETMGCGSGSCAVVGVLSRLGKVPFGEVKVKTIGGEVTVNVKKDYSVSLSGATNYVFEGKFYCN